MAARPATSPQAPTSHSGQLTESTNITAIHTSGTQFSGSKRGLKFNSPAGGEIMSPLVLDLSKWLISCNVSVSPPAGSCRRVRPGRCAVLYRGVTHSYMNRNSQKFTEINRNSQKLTETHRNSQKFTKLKEIHRNSQKLTEVHRNS